MHQDVDERIVVVDQQNARPVHQRRLAAGWTTARISPGRIHCAGGPSRKVAPWFARTKTKPCNTQGTKPGVGASIDVDDAKSGVSRTPVKYASGSPKWVPVLMFLLFAAGIVSIMLPYLNNGIAGGNWYILAGLGMILGGIITATQYR
ncbi:MAG: cell division protein CrgA [Acidimicrobiales bacterium]